MSFNWNLIVRNGITQNMCSHEQRRTKTWLFFRYLDFLSKIFRVKKLSLSGAGKFLKNYFFEKFFRRTFFTVCRFFIFKCIPTTPKKHSSDQKPILDSLHNWSNELHIVSFYLLNKIYCWESDSKHKFIAFYQ